MEILRKPHSKGQAIKQPTSLLGWYFGLSLFCGIFFTSTTGDIQITNSNEDILATPSGSSKRDDPGGGNGSSFLVSSSEAPAIIQTSNNIEDATQDSISFSYPMKNHVRFEGETLRLICEAKGNPPPLEIQWFKNHLPLEKQNRRIRIRRKETGEKDSVRSVVRIRNLEIMDKGIYRCDVRNSLKTISSESLVQVHPKKLKNWGRQHNNKHQMVSKERCRCIRIYENGQNDHQLIFHALCVIYIFQRWNGNSFGGTGFDEDDDYHENENDDDNFGLIPHPSPLDFDSTGFHSGLNDQLSHIEFQGRSPEDFSGHSDSRSITASASSAGGRVLNADLPNLTPNEHAGGSCQPYTGNVCKKFIGSKYVFVTQGLTQQHIESKLQSTLQVILQSSKLSKECAKFAIPAICHSTLPLCDMQTRQQRPRKVC